MLGHDDVVHGFEVQAGVAHARVYVRAEEGEWGRLRRSRPHLRLMRHPWVRGIRPRAGWAVVGFEAVVGFPVAAF